ncbi:hypothetical protein ElyMa_002549900 [Elysia marginata]|uniref:SMB domain-containing protein n=1 Tax=Elysia marginata TaxID=1093978 RepID=A0AAV4GV12_9GAST|nr:hypothetical protein ElyMa_002549900 [Elysia marginata]
MTGRIRSRRRKQRKPPHKFRILQSLLLHLLLISPVAPSNRITVFFWVSASSPITAFTPQEKIPPSVRFSEQFRHSIAPTEDTFALDIQANNTTATRNVTLREKSNIDIIPAEICPIDTTTVNYEITNTNALTADVETLNATTPTSTTLKTYILDASIMLQTNNTKINSLNNDRPSIFNTGALGADEQSVDKTNFKKYTPVTQTNYRDSIDIQSITTKTTFLTSLATTGSNYTVGVDVLLVKSSKSLLTDTKAKYLHNTSTPNRYVTATLAGNLSLMPVNKSFAQTTLKSSLDTANSSIQVSSTLLSILKYPSNNSNYIFADDSLSMSENLTQGPTVEQARSLMALETFRRSNHSWKWMRASKSPTSCSHRCGEDTSYPCSCDEKCVVHKTCCHDLVATCPDVYSLALVKFRHLLSASVRCDTMTSVLMVQSCPKTKEDMNPIQKTFVNNKHSQNGYKGKEIMFDILSNAPIIDYDTGIIFSNASTYECNQQNKSVDFSQTLSASTKTWVIQIGIFPNSGFKTNNQQKLDVSRYSYTPPESPLITSASLCYTRDTLSCISQLFAEFGVEETFCYTSVSEYYKVRENMSNLPRQYDLIADHICDFCLSEYQKDPRNGDRFHVAGLRVLMSMSTRPGYAVYHVPKDLRTYTQPVPWSSWTCKISDQMDLEASKSCRVLQCDRRFFLTKGGLCRKGAIAEFSVQEEVLFKGKVCRIDPQAFARATQCHTKTFKLVATSKPYRYYKVYNQRARMNATAVRVEMFFDTPNYEDHLMDLGRGYDTFYATMLVFAQKHCLSKEEKGKNMSTTHDTLFGPLIEKTFDTSRKTIADRGDIFLYAKDLKQKKMYERFFFKVCLQTGSINKNLADDALSCNFNSDFYPQNEEIRINELVTTVEDSPCVEEVDVLKSDALCFSLSIIFPCFSIMTTSLIAQV